MIHVTYSHERNCIACVVSASVEHNCISSPVQQSHIHQPSLPRSTHVYSSQGRSDLVMCKYSSPSQAGVGQRATVFICACMRYFSCAIENDLTLSRGLHEGVSGSVKKGTNPEMKSYAIHRVAFTTRLVLVRLSERCAGVGCHGNGKVHQQKDDVRCRRRTWRRAGRAN